MHGGQQVKLTVLTAADGAAWESALLAELAVGEHAIEVVRRCLDTVDLLAAAAAGLARAVLIDARLRRFNADCRDRLDAAGVAIVGVVRPGEVADQDLLRSMGVGYVVPADAPVEVLTGVLQAAVESAGGAPSGLVFSSPGLGSVLPTAGADTAIGSGRGYVGPTSGASVASRQSGSRDHGGGDGSGVHRNRGSVIAVWGPTGAPGRTTVAVGLADEIARLSRTTLLVDADVYGGVVAPLLGLLDESPGIAAACRQAQSRRLDPVELARLSWQIGPQLSVLSGITRADRWPELRPTAITALLGVARSVADFTVLDLGFGLETDEELSFDTMAPRRNGATLAALDEADLILAVGAADPIGVQRLVRGLAELKAAGVSAPVWIVVNRVRRGPVPGAPDDQLTTALQRFAGQSPAALLAHDLAALDRAVASGKTLAEAAPNSELRRGLGELAAAVVGVGASKSRRRR